MRRVRRCRAGGAGPRALRAVRGDRPVTAGNRPLVVVGDALLDVDLVGTASRGAPAAPCPGGGAVETGERPGGVARAAVIAAAATGREVVLVAPMDSDDGAARLRALLEGPGRLGPIPAPG